MLWILSIEVLLILPSQSYECFFCFQDMYGKAAEFWAELRVELLSASTFLANEKPNSSQVWRLYWASHQVSVVNIHTLVLFNIFSMSHVSLCPFLLLNLALL